MSEDVAKPLRAPFCFVHASDLRLDVAMRGIAAVPAALRPALRDAPLLAWRSLVELALAREAAFVLLGGGLFGADPPSARSSLALRDGVQRLRAGGVEVVIALAAAERTVIPHLAWLTAGATLIGEERSPHVLWRDGRCLAAVHAARGADGVLEAIPRTGAGVQIGALPDATTDGARRAPEAQLAGSGLDYWAVGGPRYGVLREQPWIVCAGTPQGRGLEPAEVGPKGCAVVEVDDDRVTHVALAPLDHIRFLSLELDVGDCADTGAVRRRLCRELEAERGAQADRLCIVEAALHGRFAATRPRDRIAWEAELLSSLRSEAVATGAPVWWAQVYDRTALADRPAAARRGDLRRIVIEQSEALGAPLPGSQFLARTFAPLLRHWDAETDLNAQRELVRDAAALAVDLLAAQGTE